MRNKIKNFREQRKSKHAQTLTVVKRSNKVFQALNLPKVLNLNPRSAIDVAFISESHDRESKRLEDHFVLENFQVISNVYSNQTFICKP